MAMAVQQSFIFNLDVKKIEKTKDSEKQLQDIIIAIQHYLYNFGHSWLYLAIGRSYYQKCNRSWARVITHIEKFLRSPRDNYTLLMSVLEHELEKFPPNSYYGKHLKSLEDLFRTGPNFNCIKK